ncbi:MAG: nuclear transport factor 2 family protein [Lysobacterales bacterium]|nr:MAG: nuclear transport factor 2 family protein [Xanthomonadales bacterium]
MSTELREPLTEFFAAENSDDTEALAQCFVDDGVVRDEGQTFAGAAAIKQWMVDAKKKYQHTVEPIEAAERGGKTVVITRVAGNFPNSPVQLQHIFSLAGDKIASLEIR